MDQEPSHGLHGFSAQGLTRLYSSRCLAFIFHLEVQVQKNMLPSSLRLLVEFISMPLFTEIPSILLTGHHLLVPRDCS